MRIQFTLFIVLAASCCAKPQNTASISNVKTNKVDSTFSHHFKTLDSYLKDPASDTTMRIVGAIKFMEITTRIESSGDGTYFGKLSFTKENLEAWHKWYNENKDKLVWDPKTKTVWQRKE